MKKRSVDFNQKQYQIFLFYFQEQITEIVENKTEAELLYSILHVKPKSDKSKEEKPYGKKKFAGKLFKSKKLEAK